MQASIHRIVVQVCWSVWWSLKKRLRRFPPLRASQVLSFGAAVAPLQLSCYLSNIDMTIFDPLCQSVRVYSAISVEMFVHDEGLFQDLKHVPQNWPGLLAP